MGSFSLWLAANNILKKRGGIRLSPSKIHHINNGVDLKAFEYNKDHFQIQDSDLTDAHTFKVIYCGSIRLVNGLGTLVDTAAELKRMNRGNIKILVYGDGDERASLEQRCKREKLDNIIFKGFVEKKYIPFIISCGDLNFIQVKQTAIMRFGSSLNKLFEYLASGKPVLSDLQVRYDIIKRYGAGTTMTTQAPADIANEMIRYAEMDPKRIRNNLSKCAPRSKSI
ncbi:MAG: glycosyltransferase [Clostridia bacterium]